MQFSEDTLQQILNSYWPWGEVVIRLSKEWSSQRDNFRENLRSEMMREIHQTEWGAGVEEAFLPGDLGGLFRGMFSVSHCPLMGGFILQEKRILGQGIGLDLESIERVAPEVVVRISSENELRESPDPSSLWVAKESLFKALPESIQPRILSQLRISRWSMVTQNVHEFLGEVPVSQQFHNAHGLTLNFESLKMGLCLYRA